MQHDAMKDSMHAAAPGPLNDEVHHGASDALAGKPQSAPADWFLQSLISLINHRPHLRLDVVLHVGGMAVSGTMVAGTAYFERFARAFPDALDLVDQAQRQTAHDSIAMHAARYGMRNADDSVDPPDYVHLIDAQVIPRASEGRVDAPVGVPLWRGRVHAVDGFQLRCRSAVPDSGRGNDP